MYYPHTSIEIIFRDSFKGLVALEITIDLPIGFPINNIISLLAHIIKVLHQRVSLGLFTMFIKIRAHRGEFLNEKADRLADEGRVNIDNVRWDGP